MRPSERPVGPGTQLGRYRLVAKVGAGGMGEVWRARDPVLGRDVAVKLLPPEAVGTAERRRRFETEARTAATVSHPNLVAVHDAGESDGVPFIVQELVEGQTVEELIALQGALPVDQVAEWGAQAADALSRAHEAGILHRDVKPANLIVDRERRLRVLDFGLAKILGAASAPADEKVTSEGMVVGTVFYMSPEQALGRELDGRSDTFSLGVVLYEMATGRKPFEGGAPVDVMHAVAYQPPRSVGPGDPPLPDELLAILEKALEKRPEDRYQSLRDLAVDLRRLHKRASTPAGAALALRAASQPTVAVPALAEGPRRRPGWRVAAAGAALLAVTAALLWLGGRRLPSVSPPSATKILVQTDAREEAPCFSPDGRSFVYSGNSREGYDLYLRLVSGGTPVRLTEGPEDDRDPAFSADGGSILFARESPQTGASAVWSVPSLGGSPRRLFADGDQPAPVPDGQRVVFRRRVGERTSLHVAGLDGSSARLLVESGAGEVTGARVSRDGRSVAFLWRETYPGALGDVWKVPLEGGAPVRLTRDRRDVWGHVAFTRGDRAVLFSSVRSGAAGIWMVGSGGGEPVPVLTGGGAWTVSPEPSPDGGAILAQSQRFLSDAWEYSLPDGRARALTEAGSVWAPARLPDGRLVYGDWARQEEELDLQVEDGAGVRTYLAQGSNPRPAPDGRTVYFSAATGAGGRQLAAVDVDGGPVRQLTPGEAVDDYPDPLPDGTALLFARSGGGSPGVRLLPLGSGAERLLFAGEAMSVRAAPGAAVFRACAPGCGIWVVGLDGEAKRLLVPEGRWPAVSRDGRTVYAVVGAKGRPSVVEAPLSGSAPPRRLFDLATRGDAQFSAVFTLDVSPDGGSLVVTRQRVNDDLVLFEGVLG